MVIGLFLVFGWSVILTGNHSGRGASDDWKYHWVAIEQFADQLPRPDLSDYASATTPGYHLVLAPLVRAGLGHTGIQLIASIWTIGFFGLLTWVIAGRFGKGAVVLMLPMLCSMYVLYPGIWLLPDNAGWLGVLAIVLLTLKEHPTWRTHVCSGVILVGLIWMRQIHIWIASAIWLSAWLGSTEQTPTPAGLFSTPIQRAGRTMIAFACTIPAATALVWFILLWGGLVPPTFQSLHQGSNPATPGFILFQLAILSVFFAPTLWSQLKDIWASHARWVVLAGMLGLFIGLLPASSYSYEAGRYGGRWQLIAKFPTVADRSPIFVLGSFAGAIAFVVWLQLVDRRDRWMWIGIMLAFTLAQSANHASWQRYHEPMLLMMVLLILTRSSAIRSSLRSVMIGCALMATMLLVLTATAMLTAEPVETVPQQSHTPQNPADTPE